MKKEILVIRFSAIGDVAMTIPVVNAVATANPDIHLTILTRQRMAPLFTWMPQNVSVVGIDLNRYKGIAGLERLYRYIKRHHFDAVADLHDVLRSKYLRTRFRMRGTRVAVIDKGRKEKHEILGHGLTHEPLKHTINRYQDVFTSLGLLCPIDNIQPINTDITATDCPAEAKAINTDTTNHNITIEYPAIGVAPFAAHQGKIYPLELMHQVVNILADAGNHIYLFGSPGDEAKRLDTWQRDGVTCVAGKMDGFTAELKLMSRLTLMISMDSSNMHMAAMMGTQTISIWGATHPCAGFTAWNQGPDTYIQTDLDCRPCSIYGNRPCSRGNYPCLSTISPQTIVDKARQYGAR